MLSERRFEDLPLWQEAIALAQGCEDFTHAARVQLSPAKRDVLERASIGVASHVAVASACESAHGILERLLLARSALLEVRSLLGYFERRSGLRDYGTLIADLKMMAEQCAQLLAVWTDSLAAAIATQARAASEARRPPRPLVVPVSPSQTHPPGKALSRPLAATKTKSSS